MPETLTKDDDPRIDILLQDIMNEGSDEFEMVGYKKICVIQNPAVDFKFLIQVNIAFEDFGTEVEDVLQAGWNGSYDELFESSERKSLLLKIFYDETYAIIGDGGSNEVYEQ